MVFGGCNTGCGKATFPKTARVAYKLDIGLMAWRELPPMPRAHADHECEAVRDRNGVAKSVVIAGGRDFNAERDLSTVDILDLATLKWTAGTDPGFTNNHYNYKDLSY